MSLRVRQEPRWRYGAANYWAVPAIGPFRTAAGRLLARRALLRSSLVFARDPRSAAAAAELGRPVDATVTDLVFGITQPVPATPRDILFNVSGLLWQPNPHLDNTVYQQSVRSILDNLIDAGRRVTVFPHVLDSQNRDNDVPTTLKLVKEYRGSIDHYVAADLEDARSAISAGRLMIGARMHACLNALSTGVPTVAMAYSRKFQPLLDALEWPHVVDMRTPGEVDAVLAAVNDPALATGAVSTRDRAQELLVRALPLLRRLT